MSHWRRWLGWYVLAAGAAVVVGGWVWLQVASRPAVGIRQPRDRAATAVKGLPESARNVSYVVGGFGAPCDVYEFDVPVQDFIAWATGNGWDVKEETGEVRVHRCGHSHAAPGEPREAVLGHVWRYRWQDPAPTRADHYLEVVYDIDGGRAYYYQSYR